MNSEMLGRLKEVRKQLWTWKEWDGWDKEDFEALDCAISIAEHISPREYSRCMEIAGKELSGHSPKT